MELTRKRKKLAISCEEARIKCKKDSAMQNFHYRGINKGR
jgi:hypothetical protein